MKGEGRKDARKALGAQGERLAANFLEEKGMRIVSRNWRCRTGELDLIAEEGETLVIVEVRTRRDTGTFGTAAESVDFRKIRQVRETATVFLQMSQAHARALRFDVVTVLLSRQGDPLDIGHIRNAF